VYFAYPNGRSTDFNATTIQVLRRHGFTTAFSTIEGLAGPDTDWMAVKRVPGDAADVPDFAWLATAVRPSA
jgi:hypothetical protein